MNEQKYLALFEQVMGRSPSPAEFLRARETGFDPKQMQAIANKGTSVVNNNTPSSPTPSSKVEENYYTPREGYRPTEYPYHDPREVYRPTESPYYIPRERYYTTKLDHSSFGVALLAFFFPVVGIVLWFVWKDEFPLKASSARNGVVFGLIPYAIWIVLEIILFITTYNSIGYFYYP